MITSTFRGGIKTFLCEIILCMQCLWHVIIFAIKLSEAGENKRNICLLSYASFRMKAINFPFSFPPENALRKINYRNFKWYMAAI